MLRSSSSSSFTPEVITPPFATSMGGSVVRVLPMRSRNSGSGLSRSPIFLMEGSSECVQAYFSNAVLSSAPRSCCNSRGLTRPVATFDTMRSISPTFGNSISQRSRNSGSRKKCSTPFCRSSISPTARRGNSTQRCSSRAPIGVSVRSMTEKSEAPPSHIGSTNSRLRMVNLSRRT